MTDTLLQTKLHMPPLHHDLVPRPRLIERLDEGLTCKLILVSAPAGFGKTTLVAKWLQEKGEDRATRQTDESYSSPPSPPIQHPFRVVWVSLDEGDNGPTRFWSYVISAVAELQTGIGRHAFELISAPQPPPLESTLTLLINDLMGLANDCVLVLDDYHHIENEEIHASLAFLIEHLPPRLHVVITSRVDPPLPLARLRARRQLTELRAEELRFTLAETAQFMNQVMGLKLSTGDVAALDNRTEGWIAGLQLAALSMQHHQDTGSFIAAFTGSHHYILDYLAEEVLHPQPDNVQTFLLQTAILDQLCASLCDAVTGCNGSQAMLEQLTRTNLFISPLDDRRKWYRYHPLFADLLRHRLRQQLSLPASVLPAGGIPELHRRAANWYERQGSLEKAIDHNLAAQEFEQARRLIEENIENLFKRGHFSDLERWLELMPAAYLSVQPTLNLLSAWLLYFARKLEDSERCLQEVEQILKLEVAQPARSGRFETFKIEMLLGAMLALQAQFALIHGNTPQVIELSRQALEQLPQVETGGLILSALTVQTLGLAYWLQGDSEAADRVLSEVSLATPPGHSPATAMVAASNLAELRRLQGKNTEAMSLYRRVIQLAAGKQEMWLGLIVGAAHVELGFLLYESNELEAATFHLKQGIELSQAGTGIRTQATGYLWLTRVLQAQGDLTGAGATLQHLEQLVRELELDFPLAMVKMMHVPLWIVQGNLEPVRQWVRNHDLSPDDTIDRRRLLEYMILGQALIALGKLEAAQKLLAQLLQLVDKSNWVEGIIHVLVYQAVTYQAQQRMAEALPVLERALALGEPERYVRIFVDAGPPMVTLLLKFLDTHRFRPESWPSLSYVRQLLEVLGVDTGTLIETSPAAVSQQLVDPLTERELEVLQLLAAGLSNQEIAGKLVIAKSTLKTHLKHIYGKLDAHSRLGIVAKAKELHLL